jgi:hypothetical protein
MVVARGALRGKAVGTWNWRIDMKRIVAMAVIAGGFLATAPIGSAYSTRVISELR